MDKWIKEKNENEKEKEKEGEREEEMESSAAAATAASLAAISGLAAYVNGKYHISQDLRALRFKSKAGSHYEQLGMYLFCCFEGGRGGLMVRMFVGPRESNPPLLLP